MFVLNFSGIQNKLNIKNMCEVQISNMEFLYIFRLNELNRRLSNNSHS